MELASRINPIHNLTSCRWRSTLILSFHLSLGLASGLFASGYPTKRLYVFHFSPIHVRRQAHFILLDLIVRIKFGEEFRSWSFPLCSYLLPSVTSYLLVPNIFLFTAFSTVFSICSSLSLTDQVSHSYKTQ